MASISFYANILNGSPTIINHGAGSGLGFYGLSFGASVPVGSQQNTTFVTNSNGISQGSQLNNTAMVSAGTESVAGTVSINGNTAINNNNLPNYLCPLNIRFSHNEAVRVQNCKLRIFDRANINNSASGVTTYVYEARHPSSVQTVDNLSLKGRASDNWVEFDSVTSPTDMVFTSSPGMSGLNTNSSDTDSALGYTTTNGVTHSDTQHDWYVALSSEPETIGSKTQYGLYFSVEYL
jgi:hypothetical protein